MNTNFYHIIETPNCYKVVCGFITVNRFPTLLSAMKWMGLDYIYKPSEYRKFVYRTDFNL